MITLLNKKLKPLVFKIGFWRRNDLVDCWNRWDSLTDHLGECAVLMTAWQGETP
jgi:hypothetical protein